MSPARRWKSQDLTPGWQPLSLPSCGLNLARCVGLLSTELCARALVAASRVYRLLFICLRGPQALLASLLGPLCLSQCSGWCDLESGLAGLSVTSATWGTLMGTAGTQPAVPVLEELMTVLMPTCQLSLS